MGDVAAIERNFKGKSEYKVKATIANVVDNVANKFFQVKERLNVFTDSPLLNRTPTGGEAVLQQTGSVQAIQQDIAGTQELLSQLKQAATKAFKGETVGGFQKLAAGNIFGAALSLYSLAKLGKAGLETYQAAKEEAEKEGKHPVRGALTGVSEAVKHTGKEFAVLVAGVTASIMLSGATAGLSNLLTIPASIFAASVTAAGADSAATAVLGETGAEAIQQADEDTPPQRAFSAVSAVA